MIPQRLLFAIALLGAGGCQQLALSSSQAVLSDQAQNGPDASHDEDSFTGRLATTSQQVGEAIAKPFDPSYWQSEKPRRKPSARTAQRSRNNQSSGLFSWLNPRPKKSPTMKEWLSRERPEI